MKKKILAAVLAMGLGVAGITVTAQAAEQSVSACEHEWRKIPNTDTVWASANSTYHFVYEVTHYSCDYCDELREEYKQIGYEQHDFWGIWCHLCGYEDEPGYTR